MNKQSLSEAFKAMDLLNEETFDLDDSNSYDDLQDFIIDDNDEQEISIIDMNAETQEDLLADYVGQVILDCCVCHSKIYKDKDEIVIDDETQCANIDEECPYCSSMDGFKIIGEVAPYSETEVEVEVEEKDKDEDEIDDDVETENEKEIVEESLKSKKLNESQLKFVDNRKNAIIKGEDDYGFDEYDYEEDETVDESLNEDLTIIANIDNYEPWGGAEKTYREIEDAGMLADFEELMENLYPDGIEMGRLNDILWFNSEEILGMLGLWEPDPDDDGDQYDESCKSKKKNKKLNEDIFDNMYNLLDENDAEYLRPKHIEKIGKSLYIITQEDVDEFDVVPLRKIFNKYKSINDIYVISRDYTLGSLKRDLLMSDKLYILSRDNNNDDYADENMPKYASPNDYNRDESFGFIDDTYENYTGFATAEDMVNELVSDGIYEWLEKYFRTDLESDIEMFYAGVEDDEDEIDESCKSKKKSKKLTESYQAAYDYIVDLIKNSGVDFENTDAVLEYLDDNELSDLEDRFEVDLESVIDDYFDEIKDDDGDIRYVISAYYDNNYRGLADEFSSNDFDEIRDKAHEFLGNGNLIVVNDYETGKQIRLNPDDYFDNYDGRGIQVDMFESLKINDESLNEAIENIDIETEHEKIKVKTEEKEDHDNEMIVPVEPETEDEIEAEQIEDEPEDEEMVDVDFDEFDEKTFDNIGESYLKKVYENVDSYKTSEVKLSKDNKIVIEGLIKFNSGNVKKTSFIFESKDMTKAGKLRFIGENCQISRGKKSFTLTGNLTNKKFISESLNYNYKTKNSDGKSTRVYGTQRIK